MDHPIRCAVTVRGRFRKRHPYDFVTGRRVQRAQGGRGNRVLPQPFFQPETDQDASGIGRDLDAGTGLFQVFGLLEYDDTKAAARQRQRRRQSADAGASDNDSARRRQVLLRGKLK